MRYVILLVMAVGVFYWGGQYLGVGDKLSSGVSIFSDGINTAKQVSKDASARGVSEELRNLLGSDLVDARGNPVDLASLSGKVIGVYFSAEWCPPCRAFTPELVKFQLQNSNDFAIVFVSSDRTEGDQSKYMKGYSMPWGAVPFNSQKRGELMQRFSIRGIPSLVVVNDRGELITPNGKGELLSDGNALARWKTIVGSGEVSSGGVLVGGGTSQEQGAGNSSEDSGATPDKHRENMAKLREQIAQAAREREERKRGQGGR